MDQSNNCDSNDTKYKNSRNKNKAKQRKLFVYGNYDRYYGYRNLKNTSDTRLQAFSEHRHWFENKDILDIGCNVGHVTYSVARDYNAKSIHGIDIDNSLIKRAKRAAKYYPLVADSHRLSIKSKGVNETLNKFPSNVSFAKENYVLLNDDLIQAEYPRYDVILALSITKWIHLNWGDSGLKRCFKRMFAQLRPGGILILESQPWTSYMKKKLCSVFKNQRQQLKLLPDMFNDYLLSEVGFKKAETLCSPENQSKGFQRLITVFTK